MKNLAVWFEIPVNDMERAKAFYEKVFELPIQVQKFDEAEMGFFPMEGWSNTGALTKHPQMTPSPDGVVLYLDGGEDLQPVQDRVEPAGGKVIIPKMKLPEDFGFMAMFFDTEGNKIGLWSPK